MNNSKNAWLLFITHTIFLCGVLTFSATNIAYAEEGCGIFAGTFTSQTNEAFPWFEVACDIEGGIIEYDRGYQNHEFCVKDGEDVRLSFYYRVSRPGVVFDSASECYANCPDTQYYFEGQCIDNDACPAGYEPSSAFGCQQAPEDLGADCPKGDGAPASDGNPINTAHGNKFQTERDFTASGVFPLRFTRYYNSRSVDTDTSIGIKWTHTYSRKIIPIVNLGNTAVRVGFQLVRQDGSNIKFPSIAGQSTDAPIILSDEIYVGEGVAIRTVTYKNNTVETYQMLHDMLTNTQSLGRLISIKNPQGFTQTLSYNTEDKLEQVADQFGNAISLTYYANGQMETVTDTNNNVYTYQYNGDNLESVIYPDNTPANTEDNPSRTYHYENASFPNSLTGITNEKDIRYVTWHYNAQGQAYSSEHAGGVDLTTFAFNADGSRTITNPLGKQTTYYFTTVNDNLRVDHVEGHPSPSCSGTNRNYTYNTNGFVETKTDWEGNTTSYVRDEMSRILSKTVGYGTADAQTTETDYHPTLAKATDIRKYAGANNQAPLVKTTSIVYYGDEAGEEFWTGLVKSRTTTDPQTVESRTISYTYYPDGVDGARQLKTIDGARIDVNDITTYTYYANGNLKDSTNALGHISKVLDHDGAGWPKLLEDQNGIQTALTYTPRGWLETSTTAVGTAVETTTEYIYDNVGNVEQINMPDGTFIKYEYDDANRLTDIYDSINNHIHYELNAMGSRTLEEIKDPTGVLTKTKSAVYDELNRIKHSIGADANQDIETTYTDNGSVDYSTDAYDKVTDNGFDALNRLTQVQDAAAGVTYTRYDEYNNVKEIEDPRGLITTYTYNALGDLKILASPDTGITSYLYDEAGNLTRVTDARGIIVSYSYDAINRLTDIIYPNTDENVIYAYDDTTNGNTGIGRLTSVNDQSGSISYYYNPRGTLQSETRVIDTTSYVLSYLYSDADKLTHIIYPSGLEVEYIYNAAGQITTVTATKDGTTQALASDIQYQPFGPMSQLQFGNGHLKINTFDLNYRLDQSTTAGILSLDFSYDYMSNIDAITDLLDSMDNQTFTLDDLYRLDTAQGNYPDTQGVLDYDLDSTGNREQLNSDQYIIDPTSNRIDTITTAAGTTIFGYDAIGNTTSRTATGLNWVYDYNQNGRMTQAIQDGAVVASYKYNAFEQRTQKTIDGETTNYIYNGSAQLLMEANSQATKEYIYFGGQVLASYTAEIAAPPAPPSVPEACPFNTTTLAEHEAAGRAYSETVTYGGYWMIPGTESTTWYAQGSGEILGLVATATVTLYQGSDGNQYTSDPNDCGQATGDECPAFTALNSEHVTEQRAYSEEETSCLWLYCTTTTTWYAQGSDDNIGTTDTTTILYQSQDGAFQTTDPQNCSSEDPIYTGYAYYHNDHLGTPRVVTAEDSAIMWKAEYTPYGIVTEEVIEQADGSEYEQNLRFAGQYHDRETGLYYNYHRYYDPTIGRYSTSDPIGLRGGINTFAYVGGNPLIYTDPLGLCRTGSQINGMYNHQLCALEVAGGSGGSGGGYLNPNLMGKGLLIGAGSYLGIDAVVGWFKDTVKDQVTDLNKAEDITLPVPWPLRSKGKWTAICKVLDQSLDSCPTASGKGFGFGYGVGPDPVTARKAAEKMAKQTLGSKNVHHPACKCTSPTGQTVPNCGR